MARAGFASSGDYSGTFASLYSANRDSARAQQDADDQDMFDKWQNGLESDDAWTTYIRGRVDAYAGDPKRQERWVTNLRKYSVVISDNQAEFAYKNGGSINQLIAYYETRLGTLDKNSTEARDLQLRVNDLHDTRTSASATEGAEKLIEGINKGTKTYGDLQNFLAAQLRTARPNSDLFKSISKQIDNVKEQIRTNVLEGSFEKLQYEYDAGKLSGSGYATKLRGMAGQFKDSDPKRYYQILEAAIAIDKRGGVGGSGGSGRGRSGGGTGSAGSRKALNATVDSIQAARSRTQALIEQYDNLGPGRTGVDPVTGKPVVFNEAKIKELDLQLVKQFDDLSAAYTAKGDNSAAANAQKAKATYISQNVLAHNTMSADDSTRALLVSTGKVMDNAVNNPDPTAAVGEIRGVATAWKNYAKSLELVGTKTADYGGDLKRRLPSEHGETQHGDKKLGLMDQVSTDRLDRANAMATAFETIARPGVTDEEVMAAVQVTGQYGSDSAGSKSIYARLVESALSVAGNEQGLATGDVQRVVSNGKVTFVRTRPVTTYATIDGQTVPVTKKVPMVDGIDGRDTQLVDIFMDINGEPTKVSAIATRQGVDGYNAWVASSPIKIGKGTQADTKYPVGIPLTVDVITKLKASGQWDAYVNAGTIGVAPALDMMTVQSAAFTDKYGHLHPAETWVQDTGTGLWYQGKLPIHGAIAGEDGTIPFRLGANGRPVADINWQAYGSAAGVPAPYAGTNAREMQNVMNQDPTLVKDIKGRDASGALTADPQGLQFAYFDPLHMAVGGKAAGDDMVSWWKDEDRASRKQALIDRDRAQIQAQQRNQDSLMRANMDPEEYAAWRKSDKAQTLVNAGASFLESSGINAIARSLGIGIDGTKDRKPFQPTVAGAGKAKDDLALPGVKKGTVAPLVTLPTTRTFTGPTTKDDVVLTLPATRGTAAVPRVRAGKEADDLALPTPPKATKTPTVTLPKAPIVGSVGQMTKRKLGGNYIS